MEAAVEGVTRAAMAAFSAALSSCACIEYSSKRRMPHDPSALMSDQYKLLNHCLQQPLSDRSSCRGSDQGCDGRIQRRLELLRMHRI